MINDLRSGLDGDGALGVRDFVRDQLHIVGLLPTKSAVDLDSFVAMDDTIVDDTIHLQLVKFRGVTVKDDAAIPKQLVGKGLPFHLY